MSVPLRATPVTWGDDGTANNAAGVLDALSIPTSGSVRYVDVNGEGYDVVVTTTSLTLAGAGGLGTSVHSTWFFEGGAASSSGQSIPYSTVQVRYYATGTNTPFYLTGTHFQFVDAEVDERFKNFSYYSAHGDYVPFATSTDPIGAFDPSLTYSTGTPNLHYSDLSVDTGAPNENGTQTGKFIEFNLSGTPISGFQFQTGRASSSNGSVEMTGLGNLVHQLEQIGAGVTVQNGHSYDGLVSTSALFGGAGTQVQLLGGYASATKTVNVDFSLTSTTGFQAGAGHLSDIVSLQGTAGDKVVLQLTFDPAALAPGENESDVVLSWFDGSGNLVNAVTGNTDLPGEVNSPSFHLGAYDPTTDFHLGYYGVDPTNNTVWAVIDHNSEFTAAFVPEPGVGGLAALGALGLLGRRRRPSEG